MKEDFNGCLKALFKYPKANEVHAIITKSSSLAVKSFTPPPAKLQKNIPLKKPPTDSSPLVLLSFYILFSFLLLIKIIN